MLTFFVARHGPALRASKGGSPNALGDLRNGLMSWLLHSVIWLRIGNNNRHHQLGSSAREVAIWCIALWGNYSLFLSSLSSSWIYLSSNCRKVSSSMRIPYLFLGSFEIFLSWVNVLGGKLSWLWSNLTLDACQDACLQLSRISITILSKETK